MIQLDCAEKREMNSHSIAESQKEHRVYPERNTLRNQSDQRNLPIASSQQYFCPTVMLAHPGADFR
jgi:hypothetical protein